MGSVVTQASRIVRMVRARAVPLTTGQWAWVLATVVPAYGLLRQMDHRVSRELPR